MLEFTCMFLDKNGRYFRILYLVFSMAVRKMDITAINQVSSGKLSKEYYLHVSRH